MAAPDPHRHSMALNFAHRAALSAAAGVVLAAGCQDGSTSDYNDFSVAPSFLQERYPVQLESDAGPLDGSLIARGDSLYQGALGPGTCTMCHGPLLRGGAEGTNLRDDRWHDGDGSYASILSTITTGVDKPDHLTMPPRGGMPLSDRDAEAIAAYVFWVSHTGGAGAEPDSSQVEEELPD